MKEDLTLGSHVTPSPEVTTDRWKKILDGKGQEVIDDIESAKPPYAGMPCPDIGVAKGQPIRLNPTFITTQKVLDNYKDVFES